MSKPGLFAAVFVAALAVTGTGAMEAVAISKDGRSFVLAGSGKPFVAWGVNYDRDYRYRLIEDYWDTEWDAVVTHFHAMKELGANVVRVHLQFGKFMTGPDTPNSEALERLEKMVALAEADGLYLDVTGLGCYRLKEQPEWYARMAERERWAAQAAFWAALARRCAGRASVLAFDLVNEPAVGTKPGVWVNEAELGGFHYVQYISQSVAGRDGAELWRQWAHTLASAIRKEDPHRLITVGLLPLPNVEMLKGVGAEVDYMSVHLYPKSGKIAENIATLKKYAIGKPLIVEETFPMECTPVEMLDFIEKSKGIATGWISFYWGKPLDELKVSTKFEDHLLYGWLMEFQKLAPAMQAR
jgi:hypothetical protein